jgi:nanoRNase/pAp phosphatase (c-di-AMP/oligoRNAs hydrolase)
MFKTDEFFHAVKKYRNVMIVISGSPDPDAIASAYALQFLLSSVSVESDIIITKKISLSQNRAFVKYSGIDLIYMDNLSPEKYDAYIVPDFQTNIVEGITGHIPCAAHIDHHTRTDNVASCDFSLIRTDSGSTSSIIAMMIKENSDVPDKKKLISVSTALMFGIQTDTDKYEHVTPIDIDALQFLSDFADRETINKLNGIPVSRTTMEYHAKAMSSRHLYRGWGFYGIGYVDIGHRDSIAITADLLLKNPDNKTVVVFALVEDKEKNDLFLDASFRSRSGTLDINAIIKKITPAGGGRQFKGAYQIRLDYFKDCPDRGLLWKIAEITTIEKLKKSRDEIYKRKISSAFISAIKRISSFFKK